MVYASPQAPRLRRRNLTEVIKPEAWFGGCRGEGSIEDPARVLNRALADG